MVLIIKNNYSYKIPSSKKSSLFVQSRSTCIEWKLLDGLKINYVFNFWWYERDKTIPGIEKHQNQHFKAFVNGSFFFFFDSRTKSIYNLHFVIFLSNLDMTLKDTNYNVLVYKEI